MPLTLQLTLLCIIIIKKTLSNEYVSSSPKLPVCVAGYTVKVGGRAAAAMGGPSRSGK